MGRGQEFYIFDKNSSSNLSNSKKDKESDGDAISPIAKCPQGSQSKLSQPSNLQQMSRQISTTNSKQSLVQGGSEPVKKKSKPSPIRDECERAQEYL